MIKAVWKRSREFSDLKKTTIMLLILTNLLFIIMVPYHQPYLTLRKIQEKFTDSCWIFLMEARLFK